MYLTVFVKFCLFTIIISVEINVRKVCFVKTLNLSAPEVVEQTLEQTKKLVKTCHMWSRTISKDIEIQNKPWTVKGTQLHYIQVSYLTMDNRRWRIMTRRLESLGPIYTVRDDKSFDVSWFWIYRKTQKHILVDSGFRECKNFGPEFQSYSQ